MDWMVVRHAARFAAFVSLGGCFSDPPEVEATGSTSNAASSSSTGLTQGPSTTSIDDGEADSGSTLADTTGSTGGTGSTGTTGSTGGDPTAVDPSQPSMLRLPSGQSMVINDVANVGGRLVAIGRSQSVANGPWQSVVVFLDGPRIARLEQPLQDKLPDEVVAIATSGDGTGFAAVGRTGDEPESYGAVVLLGTNGEVTRAVNIRTGFGEDIGLEATAVARGSTSWWIAGRVLGGSMFLAEFNEDLETTEVTQYTSTEPDAVLQPLAIAVQGDTIILAASETGVQGRRAVVVRGSKSVTTVESWLLSAGTSLRIFDIAPSPWEGGEWLIAGETDGAMLFGGFDPTNDPAFGLVTNEALPPARAVKVDGDTVWIGGQSAEEATDAVFVGTVEQQGAVQALEIPGLTLDPSLPAPLEVGEGRATTVGSATSDGDPVVVPISAMLTTACEGQSFGRAEEAQLQGMPLSTPSYILDTATLPILEIDVTFNQGPQQDIKPEPSCP